MYTVGYVGREHMTEDVSAGAVSNNAILTKCWYPSLHKVGDYFERSINQQEIFSAPALCCWGLQVLILKSWLLKRKIDLLIRALSMSI